MAVRLAGEQIDLFYPQVMFIWFQFKCQQGKIQFFIGINQFSVKKIIYVAT